MRKWRKGRNLCVHLVGQDMKPACNMPIGAEWRIEFVADVGGLVGFMCPRCLTILQREQEVSTAKDSAEVV
jgi:hypothetical protein